MRAGERRRRASRPGDPWIERLAIAVVGAVFGAGAAVLLVALIVPSVGGGLLALPFVAVGPLMLLVVFRYPIALLVGGVIGALWLRRLGRSS